MRSPFHDFPREVSAADPHGYAEILKQDPFEVLNSYKKIDVFMETLRMKYPHIKDVYIPIGGTAEM